MQNEAVKISLQVRSLHFEGPAVLEKQANELDENNFLQKTWLSLMESPIAL